MATDMMNDDYFLCPENPTATRDQRHLEDRAMALLERPDLQRTRKMITMLWQQAVAYPAREQMTRFDNMIDEYMFHYAQHGANSDHRYPGILRIMAPPGHWFGRDVPGSRWGGDSPDFIYRIIPVEHGGHYRIYGRTTCDNPPPVTYSLVNGSGPAPVYMAILDSLDMVLGADGTFEITVDHLPADGRPNHLQTQPGVDHIMIRDALGDWLNQTPGALRVERLDDHGGAPLSEDQLARTAAQRAMNSFYYTYYCSRSGAGQPPNRMREPQSSAPFGGMGTQWGTKGNVHLADDEALVITANDAGAGFRNAVLCDAFYLSIDYWRITSSLNGTQMAADADGRFTLVVAHQDPGVHNWLDTGGLRETVFGHRWQAFPGGTSSQDPSLTSRLVKLKDLPAALPDGVKTLDATGRRQQLEQRRAGFRRRFVDK